ncbi:universal stress protein [Bacillus pakistanensis]|nr:universal stress protein [Bacillus pakistanensis]
MEKILLASDGSQHSRKAAEHAVKILKGQKSYTLNVVHVVDYEASKHDAWLGIDPNQLQRERDKKLSPVSIILDENDIEYVVEILKGDPAEEIISKAQEANADLIVMGSRGLNAIQELVLGSVSHKVVQKADRPVLVVK